MLAETARLAVDLHLGTSGSFAGATSQLRGVEAAAAGATGRGISPLQAGFGRASTAAGKFGGALGHAKSQLGGLISGPLGLVGLGAGLFTVGGALEQGITKATEMGKATSRLSAITGLSVETTSALSAALEHFGIAADQQIRTVGMLEKNVGNLTKTTASAKKFYKDYGFALEDANGHVKDANTLILQSADYFNNKSIPAQTKAAALAKLYGRSWQELIPILSAGSAGIKGAEEEAAKFGLTLTKDNIGQLQKLREATRTWSTALGGLEVQLGLLVVGPLTDLAKFGTQFLAENRTKIVDFFKELIHGAQGFAAFVTGTVVPTLVTIGSAAKTAWEAVPAPLRDLLVKGFIADKALKFTFGFSPISFAKDALGGLVGDFFKKGGTPANPLFVADVTGGLGGVGAAAGGVAASAALPIAVIAAAIIGPTLVAIKESNDNSGIATGIGQSVTAQTSGGASIASLQQSLAALDKGISDLSNMWGAQLVSGDAIDQLKAQRAEVVAAIQRQTDAVTLAGRDTIGGVDQAAKRSDANAEINARRIEAAENRTGMLVNSSGKVLAKQAAASTLAFRAVEAEIKHAKTADQIKAAIKAAMTTIFTKSLGNADATARVLRDLKGQLSHTHDPKLQAALRAAIGKVETKLASRQVVADQLKTAQHILHSSESTKQKIADLKAVEERIGHRSKSAIDRVEHMIEVAKRAQVIASKLAGHEAAAAIKDKDLSVTVNVKTNISARTFTKSLATSTKFGIS